MTTDAITATPDSTSGYGASLKERVEDFLAYEAELLDDRAFNSWLDLLDDNLRYWMPVARNFEHGKPQQEYCREGIDAAWFDEGKSTLKQRIMQIEGGDHWAEEPLSRTSHMVSNVRIESVEGPLLTVRCKFLLYVNRRDDEVRLFVGKRTDVLRETESSFVICRRSIFLDQSKMLFKNLSTFF